MSSLQAVRSLSLELACHRYHTCRNRLQARRALRLPQNQPLAFVDVDSMIAGAHHELRPLQRL